MAEQLSFVTVVVLRMIRKKEKKMQKEAQKEAVRTTENFRVWEHEDQLKKCNIRCPFFGDTCMGAQCLAWLYHPTSTAYGTCSRLSPVSLVSTDGEYEPVEY